VLEFSADGRLLQAWGKPGPGYEWFKTEHGILIDDKDNVWLSGSAKEDNQILKFTRDGKFLMQIGHAGKNKGSNDTENVGGPAGLFLYKKANELFVADGYFNHRVVVFDADTGKFKRAWGAYGKTPEDNYKFPPRAQLISGDPPPQFNNPVHAVLVSNDELVYVADRTNNRLQIFKVDGTFVKEVFVARNTLQQEGTVYNFAFSPDKNSDSCTCSTARTKRFASTTASRWSCSRTSAGTPGTTRANSSTRIASRSIRRGICLSGK
jgi:DNA-binding beta-propeller fold protein YncE